MEHLVKLFSNHRQGLLGWQSGGVELHLRRKRKIHHYKYSVYSYNAGLQILDF